jgi:hypothetical protein
MALRAASTVDSPSLEKAELALRQPGDCHSWVSGERRSGQFESFVTALLLRIFFLHPRQEKRQLGLKIGVARLELDGSTQGLLGELQLRLGGTLARVGPTLFEQ